jgi:hypothetical protein
LKINPLVMQQQQHFQRKLVNNGQSTVPKSIELDLILSLHVNHRPSRNDRQRENQVFYKDGKSGYMKSLSQMCLVLKYLVEKPHDTK